MYRASWNRILHNKIDWCVRGYSHGVYNRGQDSAGILIYEQSSNNVFAYNSVTHGGDGFFLWAGQNTMDTGRGGCDDNLLYGNDFSHAPTNGIEFLVGHERNGLSWRFAADDLQQEVGVFQIEVDAPHPVQIQLAKCRVLPFLDDFTKRRFAYGIIEDAFLQIGRVLDDIFFVDSVHFKIRFQFFAQLFAERFGVLDNDGHNKGMIGR